MSSEIDKLVEVVTDLVMAELGRHAEALRSVPPPGQMSKRGSSVLVCPGPLSGEKSPWEILAQVPEISPAVLVWSEFRADELFGPSTQWKLETRNGRWDKVVSRYKAVVLLGSDLSVLAGIGNFGTGASPPASVAVAALAAGIPVFIDNGYYEKFRRDSSRLASGLVRRFEEYYRLVHSFGVELDGSNQLPGFLSRLGSGAAAPTSRSGSRAVVTVEDVEAVKRTGTGRLEVAIGTIVTPLATQRAAEWGVEVVYQ